MTSSARANVSILILFQGGIIRKITEIMLAKSFSVREPDPMAQLGGGVLFKIIEVIAKFRK